MKAKHLLLLTSFVPFSLAANNPEPTSALEYQQTTNSRIVVEENYLRFFTGGSERMTIDGDGKIGVGTTSPSNLLTVKLAGVGQDGFNVLNSDNNEIFEIGTLLDNESYLQINDKDGNVGLQYRTDNHLFQVNNLRITENYSTTSETAWIHYKTGADRQLGLLLTNDQKTKAEIKLWEGNSHNPYISFSTSSVSSSNMEERVRIDKDGNIGIGTSVPTHMLEVNKSFLLRGTSGVLIKSGHFGASTNTASSFGKWIKLAEFTLNGNYNGGTLSIDFLPRNANHGDSRQQLNVCVRNSTTGIEGSYDLSLITFYGRNKSIADAKLVHTSGNSVSNNKVSLWVKIGTSHLSSVPFKASMAGNVDLKDDNQPYYNEISETGTVYEVNSRYGMYGTTFDVDGTVKATTFSATNPPSWPDYVFEDSYQLNEIEEVEKYIEENHRLPEIPSAAEVKENGVDIVEMQAKLLQKIEELTLYVIDQNKKIESLSTQNEIQQKEIEKLKVQ